MKSIKGCRYLAFLFLFNHVFIVAQTSEQFLKIDSIITSQKINQNDPCLSILIAKDGNIIYEKQLGLANIAESKKATSNTIFNIASISKQFTAYLIYYLEVQGKLKTSDQFQKYIPEIKFSKKITIDHLISHTSGIPDHFEILSLKDKYTPKALEKDYVISYMNSLEELSFPPGERFAYSNTAYMILAEIVRRTSNKPIEAFAEEVIFKPLGMQSGKFAFYEKDGMPDNTASYELAKGKYKTEKKPDANAIGAVGVFCNLRDFLKWDQHLRKPTKQAESIIKRMLAAFKLNNGMSSHYGGGIILKPYNGFTSEEHSGGWNSFLTQFRRIPKLDLTILVASNTTNYNVFKICDELTNALVEKPNLKDIEEKKLPINIHFSSTYIDANNVVRKIKAVGNKLNLYILSDTTKAIQVFHYHANTQDSLFHFIDNNRDTASFVVKDSKVIGFYYEGSTYFRFKRFYQKLEGSLPPNEIEKFIGKYKSAPHKNHFSVKKKGKNALKIKPIFFISFPLENLGSNVFKVKEEPIYLRFYKDHVSVGNEWVFDVKLNKL